ncbi:hypothetical protein HDV04_001581 [Boothiomyces sp. JEL0838]|nr:hypothetical protein HDV04_001581 [Boothiomyces sp. JEL0838]
MDSSDERDSDQETVDSSVDNSIRRSSRFRKKLRVDVQQPVTPKLPEPRILGVQSCLEKYQFVYKLTTGFSIGDICWTWDSTQELWPCLVVAKRKLATTSAVSSPAVPKTQLVESKNISEEPKPSSDKVKMENGDPVKQEQDLQVEVNIKTEDKELNDPEKSILESHATMFEKDKELEGYSLLLNRRISAYYQDRYEYYVQLLPLSTIETDLEAEWPSTTTDMILKQDSNLAPLYYSSAPYCDDVPRYNRALIQSISIRSSWAVPCPKIEIYPVPDFQEIVTPPNHTIPVVLSNSKVTGNYQGAKLTQNVIEPQVAAKLKGSVVDLTSDLLTQGISHWKSKGSIKYTSNNDKPSAKPQTPFPISKEYQYCRLGSEIIKINDTVILTNNLPMQVKRIKQQDDLLIFDGVLISTSTKSVTVDYRMVKCRYNVVFLGGESLVSGQVWWDGSTIVKVHRKVYA